MGGALAGRLVFFRDLSTYYAPQYAFAARALGGGTWPLWNPLANAGEPFLLVYPVDLVLLLAGGWSAPLGLGVLLHLLLALAGGSLLGRHLGMGPAAAWLAGTVYGLGGFALSTVDLLPLFQAVAWAPFVVWALVAAAEAPTRRRLAGVALVLALQASTLAAEIVLQTLVVAAVLVSRPALWRDRPRLLRLALAGVLALLLAAPAVLGVRSLLEGTARQAGFALDDALEFSLHPVVLGEAALPRLLGDPHDFTDRDFWGRSYFPTGFPYLVSLYLGLPVLLLALQAPGRRRLWVLAGVAALLALGRWGPLGLLPAGLTLPVRGPQKLFFLVHFVVAFLAGHGLEGARGSDRRTPRAHAALVVPPAAVLALAAGAAFAPAALQGLLGRALPALLDPRGLAAIREVWPAAWLTSGALALGVGLVLARGGRTASLAAVLVALDLLIVNGAVAPLGPASFYELRPDVATLVRPAADEGGGGRWFSYGVAHTPGLQFEPVMARARSDVWLYYLDRQSLLPRTHALDGLEGALDVDRTGWAPAGATLPAQAVDPERFGDHYPRLRGAGVRWVLSFRPLPAGLVAERGRVKLPEIQAPLGLFELLDPLPRAFRAPYPGAAGEEAPGPAPNGAARYEAVDPHTVRVSVEGPPGLLVVLDGHHPDWTAEDRSGPVEVRRVGERWRGVVTAGGPQVFTFRYRPRWPLPAFILAGLGLVGVALLGRR